eukprot:scaffold184_cov316-Pinguiococcus_pyrenoidosus.AAC.47
MSSRPPAPSSTPSSSAPLLGTAWARRRLSRRAFACGERLRRPPRPAPQAEGAVHPPSFRTRVTLTARRRLWRRRDSCATARAS